MKRVLERWQQLDQRKLDVLLALGLTLLVIPITIGSPQREGDVIPNVLLAWTVTLPLLIRRTRPLACVAVASGGFLVMTLLLSPGFAIPPTTISLMIGSYSVGMHLNGRETRLGVAIVATVIRDRLRARDA